MSDTKTNETFALKYRPKKLEDLAGHKQIISGIRGMLKAKDVPNAFMLVGPSGVGKTTISRMLARYLNCETMDACGKCESCKAMDDLSSMDYTEVNASESGNIDTIRKLIESSSFRPRGRFRIIMLDECLPTGYKVLMGDGSEKNIEDIVDGDIVMSYDVQSGEHSPNVVSNVFSRMTQQLCRFTLEDGSTFECTPTHKMWVANRNQYVEAHHLTKGDSFVPMLCEEATLTIANVEVIDREQMVHDFTVANNHNFWVREPNNHKYLLSSNCHRLTMQAANALLKPLEEPPEHTLWILATTDPDKIPNSKAVCGRCTQLILNKPTREEIAERLTNIAKDAKLKWVKEKYALDIAEASGGHVRDAVQILQAVNTAIRGHDGKPSKKEIKQMVSDLSVKTVDLDTEKTTLNILIGIYSNDPKRLQRAILDAEDYTQIINKVLMLNYYLLNKLLIGKHEKIWETKVNRALFNYLSDNGMPSPELVALVHKSLTQLKSEMASYVVNGEHLLTAHLMGYCNEQKTEKSKIKNKKRKSKD